MAKVTQTPNVGEHKLFFRGDVVEFKIKLDLASTGKAFIRTNIGRGSIMREEIIEHMGVKRTKPGQDWHDLPMVKMTDTEYSVSLALLEPGHFEAMCFFIPADKTEPVWPGSENVSINVEPAEFYCANSIYCAFPRQFGPNKSNAVSKPISGLTNDEMVRFDKVGFTIIPPSGTFRALKKELDFIINNLNCRIIHLLPVNPTPTVYARMGRYGSPYASLDFTKIDPSLAEFDKKATPLEQFLELVDAIHERNGKLIIDVAINHTGWAAKVHEDHPEWLVRKADGEIVSPGAWGVVWGDLTELDHNNSELCEYLAEMFLIWTSRGVDGFRCDAGYMIPVDAWEYIIAIVRKHYPDTIFLLEGLGGDPAVTIKLLNKANMNWAYSELFQNYTRAQIEGYVKYSHKIGLSDGIMVHYAETHDNNRLAATSHVYARMRTGLCALLSDSGCFGFTNGVEWFAKEKVDVHEASALNWGSSENQVGFISRINMILISHPAFYRGAQLEFFDPSNNEVIALYRSCEMHNDQLLILINLNCTSSATIKLKAEDMFKYKGIPKYDLITGSHIEIIGNALTINPGDVLCLSPKQSDIELVNETSKRKSQVPDKIEKQRAKAIALDVLTWKNNTNIVSGVELEGMGRELLADPVRFCKKMFPKDSPVPIINWKWPHDLKRKVMVPPNHLLIILSPFRFTVSIIHKDDVLFHKTSLRMTDDGFFMIIPPLIKSPKKHTTVAIKLAVYSEGKCSRKESEIIYLSKDIGKIKTVIDNSEIRKLSGIFLDGNQRGGMVHLPIKWGEIYSKYDAVLAANLNKDVPVDRVIMLSRLRGWLLRQGRSIELKIDNIENFLLNIDGGGTWNFNIPVGNGFIIALSISIVMITNKNAVRISILRHKAHERPNNLPDESPVNLILRADIENRSFHENTFINKSLGEHWKNNCMKYHEKGFDFKPQDDRTLSMIATKGCFGFEPEYKYGIYHKIEEDRGMEKSGDLFSPGYFNIELPGGEHAEIIAQVLTSQEKTRLDFKSHINFKYLMTPYHSHFEDMVLRAIREFVVKRDDLKTVIAGYPWFLDWGRDTLICVRGLITAGMLNDVKKILMQFARFEENGTLPNIIHGTTVGNRDTSDAQLWFFVACKEYITAINDKAILSEKVRDDKTMLDALKNMAHGYLNGTPNGIKVDPETRLVFSPPHFTWMDTNYPAGTPREGYPIEIQAMWHYALMFLAEIDAAEEWGKMADMVRESVHKYFIVEELNEYGSKTGRKYLSDCLHCSPMKKVSESVADDHIRPNQLFAITLDLVNDMELSRFILDICSDYLLVPGGIRSLADRKTRFELPVYGNNGTLLNDPVNPYWGRYEGDEDTRRKPAYHNGTVWTWPFPSYSEAYYKVYGNQGIEHAASILSTSRSLMVAGCFGHIPEILDGDFPHTQRGCDAQAWSVTELYRVWKMLH